MSPLDSVHPRILLSTILLRLSIRRFLLVQLKFAIHLSLVIVAFGHSVDLLCNRTRMQSFTTSIRTIFNVTTAMQSVMMWKCLWNKSRWFASINWGKSQPRHTYRKSLHLLQTLRGNSLFILNRPFCNNLCHIFSLSFWFQRIHFFDLKFKK